MKHSEKYLRENLRHGVTFRNNVSDFLVRQVELPALARFQKSFEDAIGYNLQDRQMELA